MLKFMAYELQKRINKEVDELYPKRKGDAVYNLQGCRYNAEKLQEEGKKRK